MKAATTITVLSKIKACRDGELLFKSALISTVLSTFCLWFLGLPELKERTSLAFTHSDCQGIRFGFSQPHLLLPIYQKAVDPMTDGGRHGELGELSVKQFMDQSVECSRILPYIHGRVRVLYLLVCVGGELRGSSRWSVMWFRWVYTRLSKVFLATDVTATGL